MRVESAGRRASLPIRPIWALRGAMPMWSWWRWRGSVAPPVAISSTSIVAFPTAATFPTAAAAASVSVSGSAVVSGVAAVVLLAVAVVALAAASSASSASASPLGSLLGAVLALALFY